MPFNDLYIELDILYIVCLAECIQLLHNYGDRETEKECLSVCACMCHECMVCLHTVYMYACVCVYIKLT